MLHMIIYYYYYDNNKVFITEKAWKNAPVFHQMALSVISATSWKDEVAWLASSPAVLWTSSFFLEVRTDEWSNSVRWLAPETKAEYTYSSIHASGCKYSKCWHFLIVFHEIFFFFCFKAKNSNNSKVLVFWEAFLEFLEMHLKEFNCNS